MAASRKVRHKATPSTDPSSGSLARSGWGMSPTTLPRSLAIPAMSSRRAVGVVDVAQHDTIVAAQALEGRVVARVVALEVVDREADHGAELCSSGEHRSGRVDAALDGRAEELQPRVLLERAREQAGLRQHLEAVADAEDRPSRRGVLGHGRHHGEKRANAPVRK